MRDVTVDLRDQHCATEWEIVEATAVEELAHHGRPYDTPEDAVDWFVPNP